MGHGRALQPATLPDVISDGESIVGGAVLEASGQSPALGIAGAIGELGLQNARRARADKYPDAPASESGSRGLHGLEEAILLQGELGQAVVAAIEYLQLRRQALRVDSRDFADVGIDVRSLEVAGLQSAALLDEGGQHRFHAQTDAAGRSELR
jgi:hypothetical protein